MKQRDFRLLHGISQAEFARRLGIHLQTAWRYENIGRAPCRPVMRRIRKEFPEIDIGTYYADEEDNSQKCGCIQ